MSKKLSKLEKTQQRTEEAIKKANKKIAELGIYADDLYTALSSIQTLFDEIRNVPSEDKIKYEKLKKIRSSWKQQAENIMIEYKKAEIQATGQAAAGIGIGFAVASFGPTAAMGIATTFGVASTGTAISALSGAAATNAALAWLGGGALAASGGGMAAGNAFLAMAGPTGWVIVGASIALSGIIFLKSKDDKERLENIFMLISERDIKSYELAIVELNERIKRIHDENIKLSNAADKIKTFGADYSQMSEAQQYELGAYVNLMEASTMLLVNPIMGLQPKYADEHFEKYKQTHPGYSYIYSNKEFFINLCNMLYNIKLDQKDKKVFAKSLKKNKEFLKSMKIEKDDFDADDFDIIEDALSCI